MSGNYRIGDIELSPSPYSGCNKGNFAPSESDCSEYYVCNNGEYQLQKCPSGLHWNRVSFHKKNAVANIKESILQIYF